MELKRAILERRSVRKFMDQSVSRTTVRNLLKHAALAPSAMNLQPWAFTVIQNKTLLKVYSDRAKSLFTERMRATAPPAPLKKMLDDPDFNIFYNSGTLIVIWAKPSGEHPDWDCNFAAQNLMLAAHDEGMGSCAIGLAWPLFEQADVKKALQVPEEYRVVIPIIVGYPAEHPSATPRRDPEILSWQVGS